MGSSSVRPARAPGERRATTAGGLAGPPGHATIGPAEHLDIARDCRALERVVAWDMGNRQVARDGPPENLFSAFFWGDAFATLGVRPAAGRGFTADEIRKGERVAVVSHRYWSSRLASDASLVGERLLVNGEPYTLVGVMPPGTLLYGTDLWIPMLVGPEVYPRSRRQFQVLARIAPGQTRAAVSHAAAARTRELGVRLALGARRGQLRRLVVRRALLPASVGGAVGLGAAVFLARGLGGLLFGVRPFDPLTLAAAGALLLLLAAAASDAPARRASRLDPVAALREE
jgi:hypothetical protein